MPTLAEARANIVAQIVDGADNSITPSKLRQLLLDAIDALSFLEGPGFTFLWSSNIAASDPGSTYIKGNNASLASITTIYVSETALEGSISGYLAAVFSGSSAAKAVMIITDVSDHDNFVTATVTADTDSGTYRTLTVTVTSTGGSFTADGTLVVQIIPVGDQGATGGGGDVTGPASSVDSEIALFSSTTGKVIKRASTTGILKASSGVIAAAVASTDYAPATSGSAILKGNGSGGFSNAVSATDYCPATSGSAILKASSGGTTAAADGTDYLSPSTGMKQGLHTVPIVAGAMTQRVTNGPALNSIELATNKIALTTLDFDQTTEEGAGFFLPMPKAWDEGTITFIPYWTAASGTGGVVWQLKAVATSDDDALDVAMGTAQTSTDTFITANDCHIGPTSSAITIAGTPTNNDLVYFEITRKVADAGDTLTADAKLIGIKLLITYNAGNDA